MSMIDKYEEWLFYTDQRIICLITRKRGQGWTTKHLKQVKEACAAKNIPMKGIKYRFIRKIERPIGG
jgi:hypothetical protein